MAFKQRLLATAAIPFMALAGYSLPAAAVVRPAAIEARSPIVTVQSEEEVVPRKKRNKQAQDEQAGDQQNADQGNAASEEQVQPRKKKRQAQAEEQNTEQQNVDQGNAANEEQVQPRKKRKQAQAEEQNLDQQNADQGNAVSEEQVQPRRKKNKQAEADQQNADQGNAVSEEQVQPRKKKNKQVEADQQNADQGNAGVSDEDIVNQTKKKKNKQAQAEEQNLDQQNADQGNAVSEEQVQPRKKKNKQVEADQQNADQGNAGVSDEDIVNQTKKKKNKQAQSDDANTDNSAGNSGQVSDEDIVNMSKKNKGKDKDKQNAEAETPAVIEKREQVAKDPSKTTDTVVLPVENGAAVLDSDKDADNSGNADTRKKRKQEREQVKNVPVPKSDKDAQKTDVKIVIKPVLEVQGERIDSFDRYEDPRGRNVGKGNDIRVVFNLDGRVVIRADDRDRIGRNEPVRYEQLRDDRIREIVVRPNGDRIVTVRNKWGEIIRRSRIEANDREIVIFYSPDLDRGRDQLFLRDPGDELPPMRLRVPVEDYIIDVSSNPDRDYEEFLSEPPVERVERVYSVDEVKYSARLRDKVRRIDLDTITFDTGSAEISQDQAKSLRKVASAISDILDKDPGETFLIEGHTDAVGSDESNLVLSDERAESIANVLSELFEIPAENLVTQGYGERFLKVDTDEDERMNRRVTIRRISPLVRPVETSEN